MEINPVAADLVNIPENYRWSSARAHLAGQDEELVQVAPLLDLTPDWKSFLQLSPAEEVDLFHRHEDTGRPLGASGFVDHLEQVLVRVLKPQKPEPKIKDGLVLYTVTGTTPELQRSKKSSNVAVPSKLLLDTKKPKGDSVGISFEAC